MKKFKIIGIVLFVILIIALPITLLGCGLKHYEIYNKLTRGMTYTDSFVISPFGIDYNASGWKYGWFLNTGEKIPLNEFEIRDLYKGNYVDIGNITFNQPDDEYWSKEIK